MYSFVDNFGLPVTLTFDPAVYRNRRALHVLVFPFWQGRLVFTRHRTRGIELPGGKVEPGESSLAAAIRETYEETGATLEAIERIGQYTVNHNLVKDIYVARVLDLETEPPGADVAERVLFEQIPLQVRNDPRFSRYLYDDVYPLALERARRHPFATT